MIITISPILPVLITRLTLKAYMPNLAKFISNSLSDRIHLNYLFHLYLILQYSFLSLTIVTILDRIATYNHFYWQLFWPSIAWICSDFIPPRAVAMTRAIPALIIIYINRIVVFLARLASFRIVARYKNFPWLTITEIQVD